MSLTAKLSPEEARLMDIETPWEREYWARHFHISEIELDRIVKSVGPDSAAVAAFIQERSRREAAKRS